MNGRFACHRLGCRVPPASEQTGSLLQGRRDALSVTNLAGLSFTSGGLWRC